MKAILLVEDDPFLKDIYTTKLKESGFTVEIAENGEEALKKLKKFFPDIILLDIVLPLKTGWEVLERINLIKEENSQLEKMKIFILSNLDQKEDIEKALNLGAEKYFIKTHFTPSEIVKEIEKIFSTFKKNQ